MARIEAGILFVVLPALVVFGLIVLVRLIIRRRLQAHLARTAPDLLRFEDTNPLILSHIVQQRAALLRAEHIMRGLLSDPVLLIPSEYADPMSEWIKANPKEIS